MSVYDRTDDDQTHSQTFGFGGYERLEELIGDARIDTVSGILYANANTRGIWLRYVDLDFTLSVYGLSDGIESVNHQVDYCLNERGLIG
jgi:hypothetical protein